MLVIKKICDYTIPIFGNKRVLPYAKLLVSDGITEKLRPIIDDGGRQYYLREVHAHQLFAKWYLCGERRVPEDGREPRPNLVFQLGDQTEKVVYDDWNGVAAYKDQFNKNFREKVSK